MKKMLLAAAATLALSALALPAQAAGFKAGILTCKIDPGKGYVLGSNKTLGCRYKPYGGPAEYYEGVISRFGIDFGFTQGTLLKWAVWEAHWDNDYDRGDLAGHYLGVGSEATFAVGLGSNLLGSTRWSKWVLQPLSLEAGAGFNGAIGIASLELVPATK